MTCDSCRAGAWDFLMSRFCWTESNGSTSARSLRFSMNAASINSRFAHGALPTFALGSQDATALAETPRNRAADAKAGKLIACPNCRRTLRIPVPQTSLKRDPVPTSPAPRTPAPRAPSSRRPVSRTPAPLPHTPPVPRAQQPPRASQGMGYDGRSRLFSSELPQSDALGAPTHRVLFRQYLDLEPAGNRSP
jgi:hypothetical protein